MKTAVAVVTTVLAVALAACSDDSTEAASPGQVNRDAVLRYATPTPNALFDPAQTTSPTADFATMSPIYEGLLTYDKDGESITLVPGLAESFEVSPDGLEITFKLRTGVTFQDGTPFDSAAVAANIERGKTLSKSTIAGNFEVITSVETPDPTTAVFKLAEPSSALLHDLAAVPGFMVSPAAFDADPAKSPVGTGPYKLASATATVNTYERFPDYWNPDNKGFVKTIELHVVTDDNAAINGFQSGQFDIVRIQPTTLSKAKSLAQSGDGKLLELASQAQRMLYVNGTNPLLGDPRVREALDLALDRGSLNEGAFGGTCAASDQIFTPSVQGHVPSGLEPGFDPTRAKQLLAEAGATNLSITLLSPTVSDVTAATQIIQAAWSDIGVQTKIVPFDPVQARGEYRAGKYDAFLASLPGSPDPASILGQFLTRDTLSPLPADLEQKTRAASELSLSDPGREGAYQEVSKIIHDNRVGGIPLCVLADAALSAPNVDNPDSARARLTRQTALAEVKIFG